MSDLVVLCYSTPACCLDLGRLTKEMKQTNVVCFNKQKILVELAKDRQQGQICERIKQLGIRHQVQQLKRRYVALQAKWGRMDCISLGGMRCKAPYSAHKQ